jgi:hypothetical protein
LTRYDAGENFKKWRGKMAERGKYILMDLISWFLAFVVCTKVWRPLVESQNSWMEIPLVNRSLVRAVSIYGKRLSRGPTLVIRRSDL